MDDKIILAAKAAGFANQFPTDQMLGMFERFYALAFKAGMERAAEICDKVACNAAAYADECAPAIRAHAQNQPENEHDGSVV